MKKRLAALALIDLMAEAMSINAQKDFDRPNTEYSKPKSYLKTPLTKAQKKRRVLNKIGRKTRKANFK